MTRSCTPRTMFVNTRHTTKRAVGLIVLLAGLLAMFVFNYLRKFITHAVCVREHMDAKHDFCKRTALVAFMRAVLAWGT